VWGLRFEAVKIQFEKKERRKKEKEEKKKNSNGHFFFSFFFSLSEVISTVVFEMKWLQEG
jgi:hypothetical protein